jgi:hypothetical protein
VIRGIDHLVIAVDDPDEAAIELERRVGIRATGGGRHERFGTRNRIAWLAGGPYLELIGIDDPALVDVTPVGRSARAVLAGGGPGLAAIALVDDELAATVVALRARDSTMGPVHGGSRRRDDGELVEWRAAFPEDELAADGPPFLIEHVAVGAEWSPEAVATRAGIEHPVGGPVHLVRVDIATADPSHAASTWQRETGLDARTAADLGVVETGGHLVRFRPRREMALGAIVAIGAAVTEPRTIDAIGIRWAVLPATDARQPAAVTAGAADRRSGG